MILVIISGYGDFVLVLEGFFKMIFGEENYVVVVFFLKGEGI